MLHMRPRDWDDCTVEEEDHLLDWLDDYTAQIEKAARNNGRS